MIERERSIDINNLSRKDAENLSIQIGEKVTAMVDEAAGKINNLLKIYGMSAKLQVVIDGEEKVSTVEKEPKKRGKQRKQS